MSKSSLSSVVSNLVRASMGASVSNTVTDEDLDRHVAELILKEAKQKADKYGKDGIRAYLPTVSDPNVPRTNKRFLSSIIRSTDDHNKTVLRAQALAAQEIKREREEEERRERKVRAEEAAEAERMRRLMGGGRRDGWSGKRDREGGRDRDRGRDRGSDQGRTRRERSWERYDDDDTRDKDERRSRRNCSSPRDLSHRRSRHVSPERDGSSDERRRRRRRDESRDRRGDSQSHSHGSRRRSSRSASPRRQRERSLTNTSAQDILESRKRSRSSSPILDVYQDGENTSKRRRRSLSSRSPSPSTEARLDLLNNGRSPPLKSKPQSPSSSHTPRSRSPSHSPPRSRVSRSSNLHISTSHHSSKSAKLPSPSPTSPAPALPSKMDKYFEPSYDPRLDTAPLAIPSIPSTGLVSDAAFEGWDLMLEVLKARREEKEERKRLERMGISKEQIGKKSKKKGALAMEASGGESIMDIEYKKRGSVREWDLGKEGF